MKRDNLLNLIKRRALIKKRVILSSGERSSYYIDVRKISLYPKGLHLIVDRIFPFIKKQHITAAGGPTIGADPIIGGLLHLASVKKYPLKGFLIRSKRKTYGKRFQIEGNAPIKKDKVLLIDDVATTGASLVHSLEVLKKIRVRTFACLCIVDRLQGARENLEARGTTFLSLYTREDLQV